MYRPTPRPNRSRAQWLAALFLLLPLVACGVASEEAAEPAEETAGPRVENPAVGVALASTPIGFSLEANEGETLSFVRSDGTPGTLTVLASPPQTAGINLVQATRDHKAEIEAKPEGRYNGSLELLGPLGTAFQSRGRYQAEGEEGMTEDFRIYSLHPAGDRLLTLQYVYPGGTDMQERQSHLFEILGEIETPLSGQITDG